MSACETPALLSASNAMPALIAPSPMTATHLRLSPFMRAATAMPERGRDRRRRVRGAEGVVLALLAARKARDAAELAQGVHPVAAAGQHLVRVGLVADVPDDPVVRRVEDVVQRDRQLDRAEVRREVAAGLRDGLDDEFAQLAGEHLELGARQAAHVGRVRRSVSSSLVMDGIRRAAPRMPRPLEGQRTKERGGFISDLTSRARRRGRRARAGARWRRRRCRRGQRGPPGAASPARAWAASSPSTVT